ncbi:MAG: hypothetical protein ACK559_04355, partial [bacterium]
FERVAPLDHPRGGQAAEQQGEIAFLPLAESLEGDFLPLFELGGSRRLGLFAGNSPLNVELRLLQRGLGGLARLPGNLDDGISG